MKDAAQQVTPQQARDLLAQCGIACGEKYAWVRFPARYKLISAADVLGFKPRASRKSRIEMFHIRLQLLAAKAE